MIDHLLFSNTTSHPSADSAQRSLRPSNQAMLQNYGRLMKTFDILMKSSIFELYVHKKQSVFANFWPVIKRPATNSMIDWEVLITIDGPSIKYSIKFLYTDFFFKNFSASKPDVLIRLPYYRRWFDGHLLPCWTQRINAEGMKEGGKEYLVIWQRVCVILSDGEITFRNIIYYDTDSLYL